MMRKSAFISMYLAILSFGLHTLGVINNSVAAADGVGEGLSPRESLLLQFKPLEFEYTGGRYTNKKFAYRLYVPPELSKDQTYPLLLWFHGHGEAGNDNLKNLTHLDAALIRYTRDAEFFPGYILVPQVPKGEDWFDPAAIKEDDMLTVAWAMVGRTMRDYPIDGDRLLLAGVCSGGDACWEMGLRHPNQFAAIVPIVTRGGDESRSSLFGTTPIWSFHNLHDPISPIDGNRKMVAAIRSSGGYARLTEIPDVAHAAWSHAFGEYHILDWMLDRRRGHLNWTTYIQFTDPTILAIRFGVPALLIAALCVAIRYGRRYAIRFSYNAGSVGRKKFGPLLLQSMGWKDESLHS
jgi:predicted esterase